MEINIIQNIYKQHFMKKKKIKETFINLKEIILKSIMSLLKVIINTLMLSFDIKIKIFKANYN